MNQRATVWTGVRLGDGEAGASDGGGDTKTFGKTARKSSLAGADIASEFDDTRGVFGKFRTEVKHFLFRMDFHDNIIS